MTGKTPIEFDAEPASGRVLWQDFVSVTPKFATLINKMIEPDRRERYQSADEILRILDLEPYQDSLAEGLSHKPLGAVRPAGDTVIPMQGYLSPVQRQASGIRQLRSRQQRRSDGRTKRYRSVMMTSTSLNL